MELELKIYTSLPDADAQQFLLQQIDEQKVGQSTHVYDSCQQKQLLLLFYLFIYLFIFFGGGRGGYYGNFTGPKYHSWKRDAENWELWSM